MKLLVNADKIKEKPKLLFYKVLNFFRDNKKPAIAEWVIIGLISAVVFFSFIYADIYAWTIWGVTVWDSFFDGRIFEYYKYCADNVYGLNNIFNGSDFFALIILAIWNFPLYIVKQLFGINILYSVPALLWAKSLYLVAQVICMRLVYKIALKLNLSAINAKWAMFAFCASSALLFGTYIDCQTDILCMPFYLAGFLLLLNNKKKLSALLFAVSMAIKPYPMIIFFPLILVSEKNLFKCLLYALEGLSIMLIVKHLSGKLPFYEISVKDINETYITNFFVNNFSIGMGEVSLFPAAYLILCFFAYIHKIPDGDSDYKNRLLLYVAFSALAIYFAFTKFDFYRIVLIAPFGALLIVQNVKQNRLLGICFTVFILAYLLTGAYTTTLLFERFNESTLEGMLLSKIFGSTRFLDREYLSTRGVLIEYSEIFDILTNAIRGVYLAALAIIMSFVHPKQYVKDNNFVVAKEIMWLQVLPIIIIIFIICKSYFTLAVAAV